MQINKPQALGLSTRPIEYRGRRALCISALLHVPLEQGAHGRLWGEQSMWDFLAEEMAEPLVDEGVAKLTAEFLVHGRACPPSAPATGCAVRVRVGPVSKTLVVMGDRHWEGERASAPQPYTQMPIGWERAYGGADFAANPAGIGRAAVQDVRPLPNVEWPHAPLHHPDQVAEPAGFGRLDPMHPARAAWRGTYGPEYMREHAPGFAPDTDWRFFNVAPADQWFAEPLRGDEELEFVHLHPEHPTLTGRLPGLRARVFAAYAMGAGQDDALREVPMRLTTVWCFPHAQRLVLVFHGLAEIASDDGSDIRGMTCGVERITEAPRPDAHYLHVIAQRADPRLGLVHSLRDSDLLPEGLDITDPHAEAARAPFASDGVQAQAQYRRAELDVAMAREQLRGLGKDPDALGVTMPPREPVPKPDELAEVLQRQIEASELQQLHALNDVLAHMEQAIAMARERGVDLAQLQHRGPPTYRAEQDLKQLEQTARHEKRDFRPEVVYGPLLQKEGADSLGYLQAAHQQPPVDRMAPDAAAALRDEIRRAAASGFRAFRGMDLTGADLHGLDLRGADFTGAWLESADLRQANLSGANFSYAVLAHAELSGAIAIGTNFEGANLGASRLDGCVLDDADLRTAVLERCQLEGARGARAQLGGTSLLEAAWGRCDWSEAQAGGQVFYRADLRTVAFTGATLAGASFVECDLRGVDLRGADLAGANFVDCPLQGARWTQARAAGVVVTPACDMTGADLGHADLAHANFGGVALADASFAGAVADGANFTGARMPGSDWRLASARGALLRKAVLRGARMSGADLRDAMLQHADLRGADLRRSNLFQADLSRVRLDGDVRLDDALLTRTRTWPRLSAAEQAQPVP